MCDDFVLDFQMLSGRTTALHTAPGRRGTRAPGIATGREAAFAIQRADKPGGELCGGGGVPFLAHFFGHEKKWVASKMRYAFPKLITNKLAYAARASGIVRECMTCRAIQ